MARSDEAITIAFRLPRRMHERLKASAGDHLSLTGLARARASVFRVKGMVAVPPSTTPSTSNAISSRARRCGSSAPRRRTNGGMRWRPRDRASASGPFLLATG
jgi:hypothetical protein